MEIEDEREIREYAIKDLRYKPKKRKIELKKEEIEELKGLEDTEGSKFND